jgi:hypothetical protein
MESLVTYLKITGTRMTDHAARSGMHFASHHHVLLGLVVCTSAVALLGSVFVSRASATHVQCGNTITQSTTLDSDVVCPDTFTGGFAITIAADDVRLDLAGYAIDAGTTGAQTGVAAGPPVGQDSLRNVVVLNGRIEGFRIGVQAQPVVESHFRRLTISATDTGIFVEAGADGATLPNCQSNVTNCIVRNHIVISPPGGGSHGISVQGDNNNVYNNTVSGSPSGIGTNGDRPRVALNRVEGCGHGIDVFNYVTYAIVWNNTVVGGTGCSESFGIRTFAKSIVGEPLGSNARVRLNSVTGKTVGIYVQDRAALVAQNDSSGNSRGGIEVRPVSEAEGASNVVRDNNADNNGDYGIFGGIGTIDGGGNTASGNGDGTQNCTPNLTCAP